MKENKKSLEFQNKILKNENELLKIQLETAQNDIKILRYLLRAENTMPYNQTRFTF